MKKGILFSLDILVSLLLVVGFMFTLFLFINKEPFFYFKERSINTLNQDLALSLEKGDIWSNAIKNNNYVEIKKIYRKMPKNFCFNFKVYDSTNSLLYEYTRNGCGRRSDKKTVTIRSLVIDNNYYKVAQGAWLR